MSIPDTNSTVYELSRMNLMSDFHNYCEVIFWSFERKNNVVYNFGIISTLINSVQSSQNKAHFYKPIFIIMMGIIECVLYDFLCRVQEHRYEEVNLSSVEISNIQDIDLPKKLKNYTDICNSYDLLSRDGSKDIYKKIEELIEIRNRVHIQNQKQYVPPKEWELWSKDIVIKCGRLIQEILVYLCQNIPRPDSFHSNPDIHNFPTPWENL